MVKLSNLSPAAMDRVETAVRLYLKNGWPDTAAVIVELTNLANEIRAEHQHLIEDRRAAMEPTDQELLS